MKAFRWFMWGLVALFVGLFALFAFQLSQPKDDFVRSAMIGKQLPEFELEPSVANRPGLSAGDFSDGEPKLLNVFASWCIPCAVEAPQLAELERQGAEIMAVAIRDRPEDVAAFLERYGNPFSRIGSDELSQVQLALGSSGVPETFVIDGTGTITYQHLGEIRADDVPVLMAELRKAER